LAFSGGRGRGAKTGIFKKITEAGLANVFGTEGERELNAISRLVQAVNAAESRLRQCSNSDLAAKTVHFREGLRRGGNLEEIQVEAFALVREAGRRVLKVRHTDTHLIAGFVLHRGNIAEMDAEGEETALVASLPAYLNALGGKGVHIISVDDCSARRDSHWIGGLYRSLSLTVSAITHDTDDAGRRKAYGTDITYAATTELGFDYLRDNMKFRIEDCVQRPHHYAIIDEADAILIDGARTPLTISGPSDKPTDKYYKANDIIPLLVRGEVIEGRLPGEKYTTGDYTVEHKSTALTDEGVRKVEQLLNIVDFYDPGNIEFSHDLQQALRAHVLYQRDREYVIRDGGGGPEVVIIDEFTGDPIPGRRWRDGLHQAVEAKEGIKVQRENQALASMTYQDYFRLYEKLAGLGSTVQAEEAELRTAHNIGVTVIPASRQLIRVESPDLVYRTEIEKYRNAVAEIKNYTRTGQPVLVGTTSVERSERLSAMLNRVGVHHEVLNAKNHEREADIYSRAGCKGAVTVSTNVGGRGPKIRLGGDPEFVSKEECLKRKVAQCLREEGAGLSVDENDYFFTHDGQLYRVRRDQWDAIFAESKAVTDLHHDEVICLGGLHIVGTERHESGRIDRQFYRRAGRHGDPGSSRFFLSLEDDLFRHPGSEHVRELMLQLGMEEDVPIESPFLTQQMTTLRSSIEAENTKTFLQDFKYDDIDNKHRLAVYGIRRQIMQGTHQQNRVMEMVRGIVEQLVEIRCFVPHQPERWDLSSLRDNILTTFGVTVGDFAGADAASFSRTIFEILLRKYQEKEDLVGADIMRQTERIVMLQVVDNQWKSHLLLMHELRAGIGFRAYGRKDPLVEYKKESYELFTRLMDRIEYETVRWLFFLKVNGGEQPAIPFPTAGGEKEKQNSAAHEPNEQQRVSMPSEMGDFNRNIQRQKEKGLQNIQFVDPKSHNSALPTSFGHNVGANGPCPCGSGKKYKNCHGS
jgi:preprotein translocase subunit SecA